MTVFKIAIFSLVLKFCLPSHSTLFPGQSGVTHDEVNVVRLICLITQLGTPSNVWLPKRSNLCSECYLYTKLHLKGTVALLKCWAHAIILYINFST